MSGGAILYSLTGAVIVWRRRAHRLGLLMLVAGPLYALLNLGWTTGDALRPILGADAFARYQLLATWGSWPGVAIIAGWIPLLFPTGSLPGPRWRLPAAGLAGAGTAGVLAGIVRPGPIDPQFADVPNPIGIDGSDGRPRSRCSSMRCRCASWAWSCSRSQGHRLELL